MLLESLEIENYKSFWKRERIEFAPGFNLLIGANNSGKTTLLEALHAPLGLNTPHRSQANLQSYGDQPNGHSEFVTMIKTDLSELRRIAGNNILVPIPQNLQESANSAYTKLAQNPELRLEMRVQGGGVAATRVGSCLGGSLFVPNVESSGVPMLQLQFSDWTSTEPVLLTFTEN